MIIKKIIPSKILSRYKEGGNLSKIFSNIGWLSLDRLVRMGVGLLVGVWMARYFGPGQYGMYNYALAYISLFGAIAGMGIDSILIREIVKYPNTQNELIGSAFFIKIMGAMVALFLVVLTIILVKPEDNYIRYIIIIM